MKLTAFILLTVILQVSASTYGQKITLKEKNTPLQDVLLDIQQQSGYDFLYTADLLKLAKPVTISVKDASIKEVIEKCLADQPFVFKFNKKTITLKEKPIPVEIPATIIPVQVIANPVSGVVTDEKGQPLAGVTVLEKGTKNGIVTDATGHYNINVADANSTLVFSSVGYISQEVKVGTQKNITVQLKDAMGDLNEIVVVGYGTQKKVSLTGAVSSISGDELATTRNESVLNMLTGKIPGVRVVQNTAEPGAFSNSFDIRGLGSPLFVIDGVPRTGIERLDPNDIESISVLKDAAAAVYGVQAGNGVVLVTTKKGKAGTSRITYTVTYGEQHASGLLPSLDATDYMTAINEKTKHSNGINNPNGSVPYQAADFAAFAPGGTKKSTNWVDETVRRNAGQENHSLSFEGGTDKATYFIGLGYLKQDGFLKTNDENYHKYNVRSNITAQIAKGLSADVQLYYMADQRNYPAFDFQEVLNADYRNPPIYPVYAGDPGGHLDYFGDNGNNAVLYSSSALSGYRQNNKKLLQTSIDLAYQIPFIPGLQAKALYSYNNNFDDNKTYNKEADLYTSFINTDGTTGYRQSQVINGPSSVNRSYNAAPNTLTQFSLNYTHTFASVHNVSAAAIYESTDSQSDGFNGTKYIAIGTLDQLAAGGNVGQSLQTVGGGYPSHSATSSFIEKLHYDYKSKYLFDLSGRNDGSSRFAPTKRWGFFPAASAAWRVSEEGFFKQSKALSFFDNFKLRASYAAVGDAGQVNYQFISGYDYPYTSGTSSAARPGGSIFDGGYIAGVGFRTLPNYDVTWTSNKLANIGLDAELWHGGLGITADYFVRRRDGILATRVGTIAGALGATLPQENLNSDQSSGVELELTHRSHIGQVRYSLDGNISYTRTKNLHVERAVAGNSYDNWVNNTNNRYNDVAFQYGDGGRFTSFADIYGATVNYGGGNRGLVPGDYKYVDWNNDGTINLGTGSQGDGSPLAVKSANTPLVNFGLTISLEYGGFDLSALAQGVTGKWIAYGDASLTPLQFNGNEFAYFFDRWHPADPAANQFDPHTVYVPGYYSISGTNPDGNSMYNYQNASYVRLKSLDVGYTLPVQLTRKIGVKRFRLFFQGYDLFTITGLRYYDPEHPNTNRSNEYPLAKTYNFGVNVTF
ncbi:MAG TPA: TonB-dependent receptor [Mucilaginibacter sp.]|nr:TonB-dependent receptor [Mucilaginibacter sp.]